MATSLLLGLPTNFTVTLLFNKVRNNFEIEKEIGTADLGMQIAGGGHSLTPRAIYITHG